MLMASIPKFDEDEKKEEKLPGEIENISEIMGSF